MWGGGRGSNLVWGKRNRAEKEASTYWMGRTPREKQKRGQKKRNDKVLRLGTTSFWGGVDPPRSTTPISVHNEGGTEATKND